MMGNQIGTIAATFDRPSCDLPFPAGYNYDLSLIGSMELINMCASPGVNIVSEWTNAEEALGGTLCLLVHAIHGVEADRPRPRQYDHWTRICMQRGD
jgi:hypothetical protein